MALLRDLPDDYDLDHLRGALSYLEKFRTAVDGGAHRGIWTRELARNFDLVIAFEPREELALKIPAGFVHYVALGEAEGTCDMEDGIKNTGQGHVVPGGSVTMMPLDRFRVVNLDFLKLDLEGYELPALRGAEQTINNQRPAILVEQNGLCQRYGYRERDLNAWMAAHNYRIVTSWGVDVLWMHRNEHRRRL
jgi:FkbM family methyltransferase